jgi:nicotinamide-nucleotide amidase
MAEQADEIGERLRAIFVRRGASVAVAESLTGGELSATLAAAPGASTWFRGGVVAYASDVKHRVLGVPPGPVVSEPAAAAMAEGVCRLLEADVAVAVTGVAGPSEQDGQPPGTVWMALTHDGMTTTRFEHLSGSPDEIVDATRARALQWLLEHFEPGADEP